MLGVVDTKQPVICNNLCGVEGGGGGGGGGKEGEGGKGKLRAGEGVREEGLCVWEGGGRGLDSRRPDRT